MSSFLSLFEGELIFLDDDSIPTVCPGPKMHSIELVPTDHLDDDEEEHTSNLPGRELSPGEEDKDNEFLIYLRSLAPEERGHVTQWFVPYEQAKILLEEQCNRGLAETAKLLLDRGADVNTEEGEGSGLRVASLAGSTETVKLLLERGAEVHVDGGGSGTPLQMASCAGSAEIAKLLPERGANTNTERGDLGTALQAMSRDESAEKVPN